MTNQDLVAALLAPLFDGRLLLFLGLFFLDWLAGVMLSIVQHRFTPSRLADWVATTGVAYLFGWFVLTAASQLVASPLFSAYGPLASGIGQLLNVTTTGTIVTKMCYDLASKLVQMGLGPGVTPASLIQFHLGRTVSLQTHPVVPTVTQGEPHVGSDAPIPFPARETHDGGVRPG